MNAPPHIGAAACPPEVVLDLSRLLSRVLHAGPTGIDRVEMAYARGLDRLIPGRLAFAATHPVGVHGRLPQAAASDFLALTAERWEAGEDPGGRGRAWRLALQACLALAPRLAAPPAPEGPRAYLHLSPRSLERRDLFEALLRRERARLVVFVHDLIPLTHPQFVRRGGPELFRRKLETVLALASGVLVNSQDTARVLAAFTDGRAKPPRVRALPLGTAAAGPPGADLESAGLEVGAGPAQPYFVALGTIEPRKNHFMLLHLWRRLTEGLGRQDAPRLLVVGRRGWDNQTVFHLLDRTPSLSGLVQETGRLPDARLRPLLRGARALLMPSFCEGFGLPVTEALAHGVPVIASDLPALREAGGPVPDYLDPLDGLAWTAAVLDYAQPDSPRRAAQLARLAHWRAPTWDAHLGGALGFLTEICQ